MLINLSNHPSCKWSTEQLEAANTYGQVQDYSFPDVSPYLAGTEIEQMSDRITDEIRRMKPSAVLCQGESTLCYSIVRKLINCKIKVLAACSNREVIEEITDDGQSKKTVLFRFIKFREYV